MNDVFRNRISRRCLCPEDHCKRSLRQVTFFNLFVFPDCIQCIHLLSLIFMQTFDLDIEYCIFINIHILRHLQIIFQFFLGISLDLSEFFQHFFVIFVLQEFFQFFCIFHIPRSDQFFDILCQIMVAVHKPSAECDSVCLVVKFLRIDIIKRFQF